MNNKANVLPDTRERVLQAASRLGYQGHTRSAKVRPHRLSTIGVLTTLIPDESAVTNPFYGSVIDGIDQECRRQNLKLMYAGFSRAVHYTVAQWPPMLHDSDVDGFLIMGRVTGDVTDLIRVHTDKPIVLVDAYADPHKFDSIVPDNVQGAYQAVSYLIAQGHRRIGLLGTLPKEQSADFLSFYDRRVGYLQALREHGLQPYIEDSNHLLEDNYHAARRLLTRSPEITAIFISLDLIAGPVIRAACELGRTVPDRLSVIGFDDLASSQTLNPPLTTMRVDTQLMGALGVRQLIDRAENPDRAPIQILIGTQLVVRESVRFVSH